MANEQRFIYAISDGEYLKVGFAKNVDRRLKALQTSSPRVLKVVRAIKIPQWKFSTSKLTDAKNHEANLHEKLRQFSVRGEWFSLEALVVFDAYWVKVDGEGVDDLTAWDEYAESVA